MEDVLVFRDELTQRSPTRLSVNANTWVLCWIHPLTSCRSRGRWGDAVVCGHQRSDVLAQFVRILRLVAGEEVELLGPTPGLMSMGPRRARATQIKRGDGVQVGDDTGGLVAMPTIRTYNAGKRSGRRQLGSSVGGSQAYAKGESWMDSRLTK